MPPNNNDPHKIGRREPRAEYLGWLHCRQINEFVDHYAWMGQTKRIMLHPTRVRPCHPSNITTAPSGLKASYRAYVKATELIPNPAPPTSDSHRSAQHRDPR